MSRVKDDCATDIRATSFWSQRLFMRRAAATHVARKGGWRTFY